MLLPPAVVLLENASVADLELQKEEEEEVNIYSNTVKHIQCNMMIHINIVEIYYSINIYIISMYPPRDRQRSVSSSLHQIAEDAPPQRQESLRL